MRAVQRRPGSVLSAQNAAAAKALMHRGRSSAASRCGSRLQRHHGAYGSYGQVQTCTAHPRMSQATQKCQVLQPSICSCSQQRVTFAIVQVHVMIQCT